MDLFELARTLRGNILSLMGNQMTARVDYIPSDKADRCKLGMVFDKDMNIIKSDDVRNGSYVWDSNTLWNKYIIHIHSFYNPAPTIAFAVVYIAVVDLELLVSTVDDPNSHGKIIDEICKANNVANLVELLDKHRAMCADLIIADNNRPEVLARIAALKETPMPVEAINEVFDKSS
jgi:hypothetical protein